MPQQRIQEVARTECRRRAVAGPVVQVRLATNLTDAEYVSRRSWTMSVRRRARGAGAASAGWRTRLWLVVGLGECLLSHLKASLATHAAPPGAGLGG